MCVGSNLQVARLSTDVHHVFVEVSLCMLCYKHTGCTCACEQPGNKANMSFPGDFIAGWKINYHKTFKV